MRIGSLGVSVMVFTVGLFALAIPKEGDAVTQGRKQVELDIQPDEPFGSIIGCLPPVFHAAGRNWSTEFLRGYLGLAFVFSMKEDGGSLWHRENYEWSYFFDMLEFLGDDFEIISASLSGEMVGRRWDHRLDSHEEHSRAKVQAWDAVRAAIDGGLPPVVWNVISTEMMDSGKRPLPFMWSLIVGYDEAAQTYTMHHVGYGKFTIHSDAFGHADPAKWFCVMIIKPETKPFDALAAHRTVIQRALESSQGMRPANTEEATAHGLAAWEMWLGAFQRGTVSIPPISHHATFLRTSRGSAAAYLREIEPHFPEGARVHLRKAAEHYTEIADAMQDLLDLRVAGASDLEEGAKILSQAIEHERAGLVSLQSVLDMI